jgi:YqaJ-like viral recombinase domain
MIHHRVTQGSEEWRKLRCGIPTASEFHRIITPKKWEPAAGRRSYQVELITEMLLGMPLDGGVTPAMLHGKDWEPKARAAYEALHGVDVETCGFCLADHGSHGASPDAFVGDDGLLEIKCPDRPEIHVGNLIDPVLFYWDHMIQTQGQLYVTGRKWADLVSYFQGLPMVTIRVEPNVEFHKKLAAALSRFAVELADLANLAKKAGAKFPDGQTIFIHSRDWITMEDVDAILEARK